MILRVNDLISPISWVGLLHMLLQCDPRLLLYSEDQVRAAKHMINNYKDYPDSDRALWEARRMCEAAKDEILPRPFPFHVWLRAL